MQKILSLLITCCVSSPLYTADDSNCTREKRKSLSTFTYQSDENTSTILEKIRKYPVKVTFFDLQKLMHNEKHAVGSQKNILGVNVYQTNLRDDDGYVYRFSAAFNIDDIEKLIYAHITSKEIEHGRQYILNPETGKIFELSIIWKKIPSKSHSQNSKQLPQTNSTPSSQHQVRQSGNFSETARNQTHEAEKNFGDLFKGTPNQPITTVTKRAAYKRRPSVLPSTAAFPSAVPESSTQPIATPSSSRESATLPPSQEESSTQPVAAPSSASTPRDVNQDRPPHHQRHNADQMGKKSSSQQNPSPE